MLFDNSKQTIEDVKDLLRIMNEVYATGGSDVEVARAMGVTKKEFEHAYQTIPDFRSMVDRGRTAAEAYLLAKARENFSNKGFNSQLYVAYMKNLAGWSDKVEHAQAKTPDQMSDQELQERLAAYQKTMLAKLAPQVNTTALLEAQKDDGQKS